MLVSLGKLLFSVHLLCLNPWGHSHDFRYQVHVDNSQFTASILTSSIDTLLPAEDLYLYDPQATWRAMPRIKFSIFFFFSWAGSSFVFHISMSDCAIHLVTQVRKWLLPSPTHILTVPSPAASMELSLCLTVTVLLQALIMYYLNYCCYPNSHFWTHQIWSS